jgi:hypothetical protein
MHQEPWLVMSPVSQPTRSADQPNASCHQLSKLISRMQQVVERLQHFQQRYRTQLSRTDQEWLHHTQQQIEFDLARLTHLLSSGSVTRDATEPPVSCQKAEPITQLMKQIVRLAQNTTEMVQTALSPQQKAEMQDLNATGGRILQSGASGEGATVDAILILLGKNDHPEANQEAADGSATDPSNPHLEPQAGRRSHATASPTAQSLSDASMSALPQQPAPGVPRDAEPAIRLPRDHERTLDEQIKALQRLRPKAAGSSRKRHRTSRSEV